MDIVALKFKFDTVVTELIYCQPLALTDAIEILPPYKSELIYLFPGEGLHTYWKLFRPCADALSCESSRLYTLVHFRILSETDVIWIQARARFCHVLAGAPPVSTTLCKRSAVIVLKR